MRKCFALTACALACVTVLSGCGTTVIEGKKIDYKTAGKLPPLEVPPDLTKPDQDDRYIVPEAGAQGAATLSNYEKDRASAPTAAAALPVLAGPDKVRLERGGSQRWLVVETPPEQLWPAIKEFWQELGFIINSETPQAGVMETDWAENRAKIPQGGLRKIIGKVLDQAYSTAERDKFRTRVERGAKAGTSEIYISHRGMMEVYVTEGQRQTQWQPRPADPELEAEMLGRLMARLGADEKRAATDLKTTTDPQAKLVQVNDGSSQLTVSDGFERAWRRVGLALDRVGFTVEDRDRAQGLYYVRYVEQSAEKSEKKGLLSRLAFWRKDDKAQPGAQYRIRLAAAGDAATKVEVQNEVGAAQKDAAANKILGLLYEQLK